MNRIGGVKIDILEWLKYPEYYPFIFAFLAGYVIISLFAGKTKLWKERNTFEKLLMSGALGFAMFYGMVVPYISLAIPWLGFTDKQVFDVAGVFILTLGVIFPITLQSLGFSGEQIFKRFQKLPLWLILISTVEVITITLFNAQVQTFPTYLQNVMSPFWNTVFNISITHWISVSFLSYMIFIMFILRLSNELNPKSEKLIEIKLRQLVSILKSHIIRKRNVFILILLVAIILIPSIIIQVDNSVHFVTPRLQVGEEGIPSERLDYYERVFVLARLETGKGEKLEYYQVRYRDYNITVPNLHGLRKFLNADSIYVANPNNTSRVLNDGYPSNLPIWSHVDNLWINVQENVTLTPDFDGEILDGIFFGLANVSGSTINFNMTYFKQLPDMDVIIEKEEILGEYVNGTRQEWYYFYITNNEDKDLWIPYFELLSLYQNIDLDSVEVYKNDVLVPYALSGRSLRPDMYIHAHTQGNLTITLTTLP